MNPSLPRLSLAVPLLAFAAALALWAVLSHGGPALPASAPDAVVAPHLTGTSADIPKLQAAVRAAPQNPELRVDLAAAYLQKVRENGDPAFYTRAGGVLAPALKAFPRNADVLTEAGLIALARHDFRGALALGLRARAAEPDMVDVSAVLVDALRRARHVRQGRGRAAAHGRRQAQPGRLRAGVVSARAARRHPGRHQRDEAGRLGRRTGAREPRVRERAAG